MLLECEQESSHLDLVSLPQDIKKTCLPNTLL